MEAEQSEICSRWLSSSVMADMWVVQVQNAWVTQVQVLVDVGASRCLGRVNNTGET